MAVYEAATVQTVPAVRQDERSWRWLMGLLLLVALVSGGVGLGACGGLADEGKLPPDVKDPASLRTPQGAIARYRSTLTVLPGAFDSLLTLTGILTDELASLPASLNVRREPFTTIDSREFPFVVTGFEGVYAGLHRVRGQVREARGFLAAYAPDSSPALAGHLYALEGYAEVFLADVFCSGIPLSTVDFNGDYTLAAGSSTGDVYRHALALFDSASALSTDSLGFQYLAAVGKGRALLALGRYAEAAAAVAAVPDNYQYQVVYAPALGAGTSPRLLERFAGLDSAGFATVPATPGVGNSEGLNGLDYQASNDPRVPTTALGTDPFDNTMYFPSKYPTSGDVTLTLADGVEARLIEAEAALQEGDAGSWRTMLNALRTDGTFDTQPNVDDPSQTDTLWHAGRGGVAGLDTLPDPGTAEGRVNLLFRERAFWLYLTAHRQGDLRRLLRPPYQGFQDQVYPTGPYPGGNGSYGSEVVVPVPLAEQDRNAQYTGCQNRNA